MTQPRYLTKSKFKLGMQCPTKLYYVDKRDTYANSNLDDPFLKQLAIGGFQVGELARQYYGGGEHVLTQNYQTAVEITDELLKCEKVTIYEAAFCHENFFIRADILVKNSRRPHSTRRDMRSPDIGKVRQKDRTSEEKGWASGPISHTPGHETFRVGCVYRFNSRLIERIKPFKEKRKGPQMNTSLRRLTLKPLTPLVGRRRFDHFQG